eukprot:IDg6273t1
MHDPMSHENAVEDSDTCASFAKRYFDSERLELVTVDCDALGLVQAVSEVRHRALNSLDMN